uniref:Uncharacterized protein n=1 Tax=Acrobeloides nanus TaxID=290746 RepID=A0A914CAP4_9BILA
MDKTYPSHRYPSYPFVIYHLSGYGYPSVIRIKGESLLHISAISDALSDIRLIRGHPYPSHTIFVLTVDKPYPFKLYLSYPRISLIRSIRG